MTSALPFPLPHCGCPNKPSRTHSGAANGRESIIALSGCKGVLAQQRFTATKFSIDALTSFSLLSNIRAVYWGVQRNGKDLAMFQNDVSIRQARSALNSTALQV